MNAAASEGRDLLRIAVRREVRGQLRGWAEDFEAEAAAIEKAADRRAWVRSER